jgi:hypothetical protein
MTLRRQRHQHEVQFRRRRHRSGGTAARPDLSRSSGSLITSSAAVAAATGPMYRYR